MPVFQSNSSIVGLCSSSIVGLCSSSIDVALCSSIKSIGVALCIRFVIVLLLVVVVLSKSLSICSSRTCQCANHMRAHQQNNACLQGPSLLQKFSFLLLLHRRVLSLSRRVKCTCSVQDKSRSRCKNLLRSRPPVLQLRSNPERHLQLSDSSECVDCSNLRTISRQR